jgi:hypothetical protein
MASLIDVDRILRLHREAVERWHAAPAAGAAGEAMRDGFWRFVEENHQRNIELWHEEDKARDRMASDAVIAQVKRNIDRFNQLRNDAMERMDEALLQALEQSAAPPASGAPLNSETAGTIIDRLSILSLKVYHMQEEAQRAEGGAAHREKAAARLAVLRTQQEDLADCLRALAEDLAAGRKRYKVYRQMKMYNDPTLNPVLYTSGSKPKEA